MKQKMSLLNRMLLPIAPRLACEREAWRRHAQRNFYAAADRSPRSAGMAQSNTTGEQANQGAREIIRARARDLERNSDVMNSLLLAFERNVIGSGIVLQAKIRSADGTEEETLNSRIERLWRRWCRPGSCEVSGRFGFREVLALCLRRRLVDGGILVVRSYFEGRYQLQLLEVDDLDTTVQGHEGHRVIGGIEVDDYRRALAYHIRVYDAWGFPVETRRIPADRVSYLSCLTRTSQIREISPAAPSVGRVDDLNELLDAAEEKERVQCHFSMAIKKTEGTLSGGLAGLGRGFGQAQREENREPPAELLEQGMVVYLNPGEEVQPISQAGTSSTVDPLVRTAQRLAGSSVGLSYEVASRDMSQVTYSSARQGLLEDQKTYRGLQTWLIDHLCETVYEEWLDWMVLSGQLDLPGYERDAQRYQEHVWLCSGWDWIDPLKEANANRIALETGQTTMQALCAARGTDWKEVAEQRAQEQAYLEQLGLLDNGGMKDGKANGQPARSGTAGAPERTAGMPGGRGAARTV